MPDDEPITEYDCKFDATHALPGPDVRIMRSGDADFIVACDCSSESLDEVDEPPHPTDKHIGNVDGNAPTKRDWLRLDNAADGFYGVEPWASPEGYDGTHLSRRTRVRERVVELTDEGGAGSFKPDEDAVEAREVPCPECDVDAGQVCKRPSGHSVRQSHQRRIEAAKGDREMESNAAITDFC